MYSKSKSKSKTRRYGEWGEWIWSEDYRRYYRQRVDANGEYETEWDPRGAQSTVDAETPREAAIDDITDDIAGLQTPSAAEGYDAETEYAVYRNKGKSTSRSAGKRPSRSDDEPDIPNEEPGDPSRHYKHPQEPVASYYDPETGQYFQYQDRQPDTGGSSYDPNYPTDGGDESRPGASDYPRGSKHPRRGGYQGDTDYAPVPSKPEDAQYRDTYPGEASYADAEKDRYPRQRRGSLHPQEAAFEDEDAEVRAAMAASRQAAYYDSLAGEPSGSAYAYEHEEEGAVTPKAGRSSKDHIAATEGYYEQLDPRYRVEHSSRFQPGEIFKVLWSEPQGTGKGDGPPSVSDRGEFQNRFGIKFFVGFRRFIVVANDHGHSTCVPILTYGGKGCRKKGVKPEKHGVIHEKGNKSRLLKDEPKLGFPPAKVEITEDSEKLSKESRVNYSKLVTVEHNVKVFFIGRVVASDWEIVSEAVNRCWEEKIHHKRRYFK